MWGEVLPIGLLVAATIFLLANTFFTQQTPPVLVEEEHRGRQRYGPPASNPPLAKRALSDIFTNVLQRQPIINTSRYVRVGGINTRTRLSYSYHC